MRGSRDQRDSLVLGRVIGDVLDNFERSVNLRITYDASSSSVSSSNGREVTIGGELKPSQVVNQPRVDIGGRDLRTFYTLVSLILKPRYAHVYLILIYIYIYICLYTYMYIRRFTCMVIVVVGLHGDRRRRFIFRIRIQDWFLFLVLFFPDIGRVLIASIPAEGYGGP